MDKFTKVNQNLKTTWECCGLVLGFSFPCGKVQFLFSGKACFIPVHYAQEWSLSAQLVNPSAWVWSPFAQV